MPVKIQSTDPEIWRTHDAEWVAERTQEWRKVLHRLREPHLNIKREQMQQLKSYFFTGAHCPIEKRMSFGGIGIAKFYVWWLHPVEPTEYWFSGTESDDLSGVRSVFDRMYTALLPKSRELDGDTYGVMGGRELSLMRAINPGLDYKVPQKIGGSFSGNLAQGGGECLWPLAMLSECMGSTRSEIKSENYVAFSPGVVLWDHLDYTLEHYDFLTWAPRYAIQNPEMADLPRTLVRRDMRDKRLRKMLVDLLMFFDRDPADAARQRPRTVALVEELLARYERRNFGDNLLQHWDAAKQAL